MTTLDTDTRLATAPTDLLRLCLAAAVVAPTLLLIASVIGIASGDVNTSGWSGGALIMAFAAFGPAFMGIALVASPRVPALARSVLVIGGLVTAAGAGFGVDLIAAGRVGERLPMPPDFAPGTVFLAIPGLMLPVLFILIGITLVRSRLVPLWLGLIVAIGGALFPAGRVPRPPLSALMLAADLLLLTALVLVVVRLWPAAVPDRTTVGLPGS
jgi:hypothetical protein